MVKSIISSQQKKIKDVNNKNNSQCMYAKIISARGPELPDYTIMDGESLMTRMACGVVLVDAGWRRNYSEEPLQLSRQISIV